MATLYREFRQQSEIDAQYNAGASVPDFPAHLARWREDSAAARRQLPCELRVPYGPTLAETLDIFPAEAPGAPVLVFVHGGYWRALDAEDFSFVALGPRARGFTTVSVNYALCPWVSLDEITRQVRASLAWVHRNIARWNGDAQRIVLAGHSAGGQLTAMGLLTDWEERYGLPADLVKAAVPISGLYDLRPLRFSYLQPSLQLDEGAVQRNSPLDQLRPVSAPVLVCWGERESSEFARQSNSFADALAAGGSRVERLAVPEAHHFNVLDGFREADSPICRWIAGAV
ncbi:alpha/beta hydrolase [Ramlibacter rhizophilus]|uniref:Alpha/beta hydrolase n=1 Tax=Ramlibacter rhizophilus TaxID=1781167 RepID=A0A4Z0BD90_9BURK|nr:alpha/beta hydrolase [Ramlibacter rhizophilus]TFY97275.1 alpha/beta hydrolase [Ramlibacter rhizophilus]